MTKTTTPKFDPELLAFTISIAEKLEPEFVAPLKRLQAQQQAIPNQVIFSHPTKQLGLRGIDNFGNGAFGATRDGGTRKHNGTDYLATKGQSVYAIISGTVSKIGYAYGNDLSYRIIDVTGKQGYVVRHFYTAPLASITKGTIVKSSDIIGNYQSLDRRYKGITEHVHIEIRKNSVLINPTTLIP